MLTAFRKILLSQEDSSVKSGEETMGSEGHAKTEDIRARLSELQIRLTGLDAVSKNTALQEIFGSDPALIDAAVIEASNDLEACTRDIADLTEEEHVATFDLQVSLCTGILVSIKGIENFNPEDIPEPECLDDFDEEPPLFVIDTGTPRPHP